MHNDCTITFKLGLAAIRSLYRFDRLPPALHGVKQFDNCISAWPYGQAHAFYPFWPAHRPHCAARQYASTIAIDVQHMPHHDCFQINLRSAIAVCPQRLHHCASAWPCGQALSLSCGFAAKRSLYSSARLPPALRGASACLNYSNRTAFSLCGWPHFDCFQATLLSTIAVCPQRLPIAFKLGLAAKRFLLFGPLTRYFAFLNCCASTAIASLYFRLALRPSALCIP